jgi:UDP-N-acetylglucosamine 1-carboxyvinyltransferase
MSKRLLIKGGVPLSGSVEISGYKNSAGALLASTLLSSQEYTIENLPRISDVFDLIEILKAMGVKVEWKNPHTLKVCAKNVNPERIPSDLFEKIRISVLLIGPLLTRFPKIRVPHPGGDKIGIRPITTHLELFKSFGAKVTSQNGFYELRAPKNLTGKCIVLKEFSVTATENAMMIASAAKGTTIIELAAAEPQIQDLGAFLQKMGVKIQGLGTHTITIEGIKKFKKASHRVCPDLLEAGTFLVAIAASRGKGTVKNVNPTHLVAFLDKLREIGVSVHTGKNFIRVNSKPRYSPAKVQVLPYPGFPTDLQPQISILLTQASGKSIIHEPLYENRFTYLHELRKMGGDVEITDPHRALVFGKTQLTGNRVQSLDIRSGATIILAGLIAKGETMINDISQVERGHERFIEKLKKLGARIRED